MAATDLYDVAAELLDQVVAALEADGRDVPERRYVAEGNVAVDCAQQLTVAFVDARLAPPGAESPTFLKRMCPPHGRTAVFEVHLTRCAATLPDGAIPTTDALDASAQGVMGDGWSVLIGLTTAFMSGDWLSPCDTINLGPLVRWGPEGGAVGFTLAVEVEL